MSMGRKLLLEAFRILNRSKQRKRRIRKIRELITLSLWRFRFVLYVRGSGNSKQPWATSRASSDGRGGDFNDHALRLGLRDVPPRILDDISDFLRYLCFLLFNKVFGKRAL